MGFGSSPLGLALFGADVVPSPGGPPRQRTAPRALELDGATRDYALDVSTGLYVDGDTIDQRVALALLVAQGSLAFALGVGSTLRAIRVLGTPDTQRLVEDAVARALRELVAAGDVQIEAVEQESTRTGQLRVAVTYRKPRREQTRTAAFVLG